MFHKWLNFVSISILNLQLLSIVLFHHCTVIAQTDPNNDRSANLNHSQPAHGMENFPWKPFFEIDNKRFQKLILPSYIDWNTEVFQNPKLSEQCRTTLKNAWESVMKQKTWAVKLFDSWAKFPPSGAWLGTLTDFGSYDQCMSIEKPIQYCLVDSKIPMPQIPEWHNLYQPTNVLPSRNYNNSMIFDLSSDSIYHALANVSSIFYYVYVQTGICLPQECSTQNDVLAVSQLYASKLGLNVTNYSCESNKKVITFSTWNIAQYGAVGLLVFATCLNIVAFFFPNLSTILRCFHPVENVKKIFLTDSKEDLNCIHGLRFITMLWIITGHTLEWNSLNIFRNTFALREQLSDLPSQPFFKAYYSVDTFFYLSGLLTSYVTFKVTGGDFSRFKVIPYLIIRYLRLTPQLAAFLLISSLLPIMFDGPLWGRYMGFFVDRCRSNWWINMLYLQNLIDLENICMVHTWYLAVDMQLHWLALIPILVIFLNRRNGLILSKSIILFFSLFSAVWVFYNKLPPGSVITSKNNFLDEQGRPTNFTLYFFRPWSHAPVFFIGFIFGCFIDRFNNKKYLLSPMKRAMAWLITIVIYLFCTFNTIPWLYGRPYDPAWSAVIFPLNLVLWSIHLTMIVWLCISQNGGIVNQVLSSSILRSFSRITYCVYLVHPWAFAAVVGSRRSLISNSILFVISLWLVVIVFSYMIALVFTVLFEVPLFHFLEYFKDKNYPQLIEDNNANSIEIESKDCKELHSLCDSQK